MRNRRPLFAECGRRAPLPYEIPWITRSRATPRLAQDNTAPYSYRRNVSTVGSHVLTARATDNAGATTTSSPVTITVTKKC
jgi:hypothetical protein